VFQVLHPAPKVQLEHSALVPGPAIMPPSRGFSTYWFASLGNLERRQPEEGRNTSTQQTIRFSVDRFIHQRLRLRQGDTPYLISQTPESSVIRMKNPH